jgi:site-specific recombinase XerD
MITAAGSSRPTARCCSPRHTVTRLLNEAGARAGLPHFHAHQLRHSLATQAINRGMSLEAIGAVLGQSLDMTLSYAKIAKGTVADEYFAVTNTEVA